MKTLFLFLTIVLLSLNCYAQNKTGISSLKTKSVISTLKNNSKPNVNTRKKTTTNTTRKTTGNTANYINNLDAVFKFDNPYTLIDVLSKFGVVESKSDDYPTLSITLSDVKLNHGKIKASGLLCIVNNDLGSKIVILYFDDNTFQNKLEVLVDTLLSITSRTLYMKGHAIGIGNYAGNIALENLGFEELHTNHEENDE